jgi:hypothetical protein
MIARFRFYNEKDVWGRGLPRPENGMIQLVSMHALSPVTYQHSNRVAAGQAPPPTRADTPSAGVAVAAGFLPGVDGPAQVGQDGFEA